MAYGEGLDYWMQWQVLVCALIITIPAAAATVVISRARTDPLRSVDLWVPCWRGLHPLWLLAYRSLALLVMSWLLYHVVLLYGAVVFYFYTQWTFMLVIIYFAIATLISARECWIYLKQHVDEHEEANAFIRRELKENTPSTLTSRANKNQNAIKLQSYSKRGENEQEAGFWGYTMQVAYQTSAGAVMLTDIVFWGLLVPFLMSEQFSLNLVLGCMHSLNAVFLILDTVLNRLPFPRFRMAYFVLWGCIYVTFQWVLNACCYSWWPYPFLELATPWAPIWYICLGLVHIPCYGLYNMIVKAKNSYFTKINPHAYLKA